MGVRVRAALRLICAISILAGAAWAQLARYDGFVAPAGYNFGPATIAVCQSGGSGGPPCTPQALIYADATGKYQIQQPFQTDMNGRFYFYAPAGLYVTDSYGAGYTTTLTNITVGAIGPAIINLNAADQTGAWNGNMCFTISQDMYGTGINPPVLFPLISGVSTDTTPANHYWICQHPGEGYISLIPWSISGPIGQIHLSQGDAFVNGPGNQSGNIFFMDLGTAEFRDSNSSASNALVHVDGSVKIDSLYSQLGQQVGAWRIYNSGSSYTGEYGGCDWSTVANVFTCGTFANGGTARNLELISATSVINVGSGSAYRTGTNGSSYFMDLGNVTFRDGAANNGGSVNLTGHLNNSINHDVAGTCTAVAATTCTVSFTVAFTSAPACVATDQTNIVALKVTPSTTQLVITTASSSSDVFAYHCIGSPN